MNKSLNKVLLGSTTLLALGAVGHNAEAAFDNVSIQAIILDPVTISASVQMNFGSLTQTGAGTAVLSTGGAITGTTNMTSVGGTIAAGGFQIGGSIGRAISITTPANAVLNNGGDTMLVDTFSLLAPGGAGGATNTGGTAVGAAIAATLTASPITAFRLGGTLNAAALRPAGTYAGNVVVTAVY